MRGASSFRRGYSLRFRCKDTELKSKCLQPGGYDGCVTLTRNEPGYSLSFQVTALTFLRNNMQL